MMDAWQQFALLELMKQISREDPELWQRIMQFSNERVFRRTNRQRGPSPQDSSPRRKGDEHCEPILHENFQRRPE